MVRWNTFSTIIDVCLADDIFVSLRLFLPRSLPLAGITTLEANICSQSSSLKQTSITACTLAAGQPGHQSAFMYLAFREQSPESIQCLRSCFIMFFSSLFYLRRSVMSRNKRPTHLHTLWNAAGSNSVTNVRVCVCVFCWAVTKGERQRKLTRNCVVQLMSQTNWWLRKRGIINKRWGSKPKQAAAVVHETGWTPWPGWIQTRQREAKHLLL